MPIGRPSGGWRWCTGGRAIGRRRLELWRQAAAGRQIYAHVELAKFYEHKARDCHTARHWTEAALSLINAPHFPPVERRRLRPELEHRLARLQRKLG